MFLVSSLTVAALAEDLGQVTGTSVTASNNVRMLVTPPAPYANRLVPLSADSPAGPWWKEPDFTRSPAGQGYEYLTPLKPWSAGRYYRFGILGQTQPYIRLISPKEDVRRGLTVTLLGANFAPAPAGNTVTFQSLTQSWTAVVTAAATNYLVITVPSGLPVASTVVVYAVSVTTAQGTGNRVGCSVIQNMARNQFKVRPEAVWVAQPPGPGRQTLAVGGGVPPYRLVPQSTNDMRVAVATLEGPVLVVTAATNVQYGSIYVTVQDSSTGSVQQAQATVNVFKQATSPGFQAAFHTLLGGTAPGLTLRQRFQKGDLQIESMELRLLDARIETGRLEPGQVVGLVKLVDPYHSSAVFGFAYLEVTEVSAGRAKFDVIALGGSGSQTLAQGEFVEQPPTVVFNMFNVAAGSLAPELYDQELVITDDLLRLPRGAGQQLSIVTTFYTASTRDDSYVPHKSATTNTFTTTGIAPGAPSIHRLMPVQGEIGRNVILEGAGLRPSMSENAVTFAGREGTRVAAEILGQGSNQLVVAVPPDAITGPVRLTVAGQTGNDFSFFVRFHPKTALLFDSLIHDTPTALRLMHQQPVDDYETVGELPPRSIVATLSSGRIEVTNLTLNQEVGTVTRTSFSDGRPSVSYLYYAGQESDPPQRHIFQAKSSSGSSYVLSQLHYSENANGVTLEMVGGTPPLFPLSAGGLYDVRFTAPIYRPPATAGTSINIRLEAVSAQWMAFPGNEMRRMVNVSRQVQ